jgi:hypothetical protein
MFRSAERAWAKFPERVRFHGGELIAALEVLYPLWTPDSEEEQMVLTTLHGAARRGGMERLGDLVAAAIAVARLVPPVRRPYGKTSALLLCPNMLAVLSVVRFQ